MIRVFLALPLFPAFESEIRTLLESCRKVSGTVKWAQAEQVHVTLHFFGDIPEDSIAVIEEAVAPEVKTMSPLRLSLSPGFGYFPAEDRPRIVWAGLAGDIERLKSFQKKTAGRLQGLGFQLEDRPFRVHATLGRVKRGSRQAWQKSAPVWNGAAERKFDRLVLFQSTLKPEGPVYEALRTFVLEES